MSGYEHDTHNTREFVVLVVTWRAKWNLGFSLDSGTLWDGPI